jgi:hypothetical protein
MTRKAPTRKERKRAKDNLQQKAKEDDGASGNDGPVNANANVDDSQVPMVTRKSNRRPNTRRLRERDRNKGNPQQEQKAKEALGDDDASGNDGPVNVDDSHANPKKPRAKEGRKRKASRTTDVDSGEEEVLAAGRRAAAAAPEERPCLDESENEKVVAGRKRVRKTKRARRTTRHNAADNDNADGVMLLPVKQLQLPVWTQEETEEQVYLCEMSLKALISRKQKLEKELSRSRYVM